IARRRVDGVAEQHELKQRQRDHGRERDAVAPQLEKFLDDHGADPAPESAAPGSGGGVHCSLPPRRFISSMNTSSRLGAESVQVSAGSLRYGAIAASSAARSRPETCRLVPNGATMSTPGAWESSAARCARPSPLTR